MIKRFTPIITDSMIEKPDGEYVELVELVRMRKLLERLWHAQMDGEAFQKLGTEIHEVLAPDLSPRPASVTSRLPAVPYTPPGKDA